MIKYSHMRIKRIFLTKSIIATLIITIVIFSGCDLFDNIKVEKVKSTDIINNSELYKQPKQKEQNTFYFGFDPRNSPQKDVAQYIPLMNYLEEHTGFKFKLHFTPKNSSTVEELGKNYTQFALMGAMGFLKSQILFNTKVIVRGINKDTQSKYRSFFVTKANSTINKMQGHKLAFGNINSTQGNLIPRIELKKNDIDIETLKGFGYTGSHQKCAEAVISGSYDICAMQDQLAQKLSNDGLLKIIYKSSWYPSSGIVVNGLVPREVIDKVKKALISFEPQGKDKGMLLNWENTEMPLGFTNVKANDYDNLKFWALKLGLLPTKE